MFITCECPQVINLGTLLSDIYINDLTNISKLLRLELFADDTIVYCAHDSMEERQSVGPSSQGTGITFIMV